MKKGAPMSYVLWAILSIPVLFGLYFMVKIYMAVKRFDEADKND